jgi:hypothetical protein
LQLGLKQCKSCLAPRTIQVAKAAEALAAFLLPTTRICRHHGYPTHHRVHHFFFLNSAAVGVLAGYNNPKPAVEDQAAKQEVSKQASQVLNCRSLVRRSNRAAPLAERQDCQGARAKHHYRCH